MTIKSPLLALAGSARSQVGPDGNRGVDPKLPGAHHQVDLTEFGKNLAGTETMPNKTGAKLIWCNTTPVPEGTT